MRARMLRSRSMPQGGVACRFMCGEYVVRLCFVCLWVVVVGVVWLCVEGWGVECGGGVVCGGGVWCGVVWCGVVLCGVVMWCGVVW